MKKAIPIGYENFKEIIERSCYLVDKTDFIKELIDTQIKVALFTRPRRFGKTLNMSMLQYFFEKTPEDNSYLFKDLKIAEYGDTYMKYQGQYPVISVTFKSMKQMNFQEAFDVFCYTIIDEFERHRNILKSDKLSTDIKNRYKKILSKEAGIAEYKLALGFLSDCLKKVYDKDVVVLIDEYDVPLENANHHGFYEPMVDLIRTVFEKLLKTNNNLHMGILTGCLRVSKEAIFTGLNNLEVHDVKDEQFSQCFGFTEADVRLMLSYYEKNDIYDTIKAWYDGYMFGISEIYNPFSVVSAVKRAVCTSEFIPALYWSNTSSNSIIKDLITQCDENTKDDLERLVNLETIQRPVYDNLTYDDINNINDDAIWSFLLFTGYLKQKKSSDDDYLLQIPNREVLKVYTKILNDAFKERVTSTSRDELLKAVINGDAEAFENILGDWLYNSISYFDESESFYHGVVLGVFSGFTGFSLKSNRESGKGRFDLTLYDARKRTIGVVMEFKYAEDFDDMEIKAEEALKQIENMDYPQFFKEYGIKNIIKYGVAFYKKSCCVKGQK